mmetsp:Transcript_25023/g.44409  ORF Transcript_25023/g.44409 Transcript_25023/m.44409 type:complete len:312 (+) Transcript_25023:103-1038(+)
MAFFKGIGNAFGTVGGALVAPFDGGHAMRDQAKRCEKEWNTVGRSFGPDGGVTQFCENIPVVGYVPAACHGIAGNHEHAKRAAARCTNSTVATGAVIGAGVAVAATGGGAAVAMGACAAAGAAGSAAGNGIQRGFEEGYSEEAKRNMPGAREVTDMKPEHWISGMAVGAVSGAVGASGAAGSAAKTVANETALTGMKRAAVKRGVEACVNSGATEITAALAESREINLGNVACNVGVNMAAGTACKRAGEYGNRVAGVNAMGASERAMQKAMGKGIDGAIGAGLGQAKKGLKAGVDDVGREVAQHFDSDED